MKLVDEVFIMELLKDLNISKPMLVGQLLLLYLLFQTRGKCAL